MKRRKLDLYTKGRRKVLVEALQSFIDQGAGPHYEVAQEVLGNLRSFNGQPKTSTLYSFESAERLLVSTKRPGPRPSEQEIEKKVQKRFGAGWKVVTTTHLTPERTLFSLTTKVVSKKKVDPMEALLDEVEGLPREQAEEAVRQFIRRKRGG